MGKPRSFGSRRQSGFSSVFSPVTEFHQYFTSLCVNFAQHSEGVIAGVLGCGDGVVRFVAVVLVVVLVLVVEVAVVLEVAALCEGRGGDTVVFVTVLEGELSPHMVLLLAVGVNEREDVDVAVGLV